jgi:hypothetical protein
MAVTHVREQAACVWWCRVARSRRGGHRPSTVRSAAAHRKNKIWGSARQESVKTRMRWILPPQMSDSVNGFVREMR